MAASEIVNLAPGGITCPVFLPDDLYRRIQDFVMCGKSGNITLNVKSGVVLSWSIEEKGRIDKQG